MMIQAPRGVLAMASARSYILFGEYFPRKMLSFSSMRKLQSSASYSQTVDGGGALTVESLEVKTKVESRQKDKAARFGKLKSLARSSSPPNVRPAKNASPKSVHAKTPIVIDETLFSAKSFEELGLPPLLLYRLNKEGLNTPTEVQSAAIPTISKRYDAVIQSYTGSGKTLAYLLPILSEVGPLRNPIQGEPSDKKSVIEAVIVAPSRELGMQIVREVEKILGADHKKLVQQLVGGANRSRQEEALKKNKPIIVVGTPGRIAEISAAGKLHTHACRFLVLDEVDQLLAFNYREDMHRILEHVGRRSVSAPSGDILGPLAQRSDRQTIMVSATIPFSVVRAARSWGRNPVVVRAKSIVPLESIPVQPPTQLQPSSDANSSSSPVLQSAVGSLPPSLELYYSISKAQHKVDTLRRCVYALDANSVIAFMNNTKPLKDVVHKLQARGMKAEELHGDIGKLARSTVLKKFRDGEFRVLVTNELSARGLDIPECDLVVNLDLPTDSVHYAHRAGRTGRLGRKGTVVTIIEESEIFVVKKIRRQLDVGIKPCEFSDGKIFVKKVEDME